MEGHEYFIAIYTHICKDYCDKQFFERVAQLSNGNPVHVVDNTGKIIGKRKNKKGFDGSIYFEKLKTICNYPNFYVYHLDVNKIPSNSLFQRNVKESANHLREIFIKTEFKKFLIIESDVLPPLDLLEKFDKKIPLLPSNWGMLGALYHNIPGIHNRDVSGLHQKHHVLSGCTVYQRELIEKYPFRYNQEALSAFPDAFICADAAKEFTFWDDHDIICEHLHGKHGERQAHPL